MGSTHSHGKRIAAMKAADDVIYYVGMEKTCESNVYPRTPRWGVVFMGTVEQVIEQIFTMASSCEGGLLKGAGGRDILPENYIAGWMREMANPLVINADETVTIYTSDSWSAPVESNRIDAFMEHVDALDHEPAKALAAAVRAKEKVTLSLYEHFGLVAGLFGNTFAAPWRVLREWFCSDALDGHRNAELGRKYAPAKPSKELGGTYMRGMLHGDYMTFELGEDQLWRSIGDKWECVQQFVRSLAKHEIDEPGTFRHQIKAYRVQLETAPTAPMDQAACVVMLDGEIPRYLQSRVSEAQEQIKCKIFGSQVTFNIPDVPDVWLYYFARSWGSEWSYWLFTKADSAGATTQAADQLQLIA